MPNHVTNEVIIRTQSPHTARLIIDNATKDGCLNFNAIIPTPPNIYQGDLGPREEAIYGDSTWYTWNRAHWGTKWPAYDGTAKIVADNLAVLRFDTAWGIPRPVLLRLSQVFDTPLNHSYFDEGENFWGIDCYHPQWGHWLENHKIWSDERDTLFYALSRQLKGWDRSFYKEDK